MRTTFKIDDDVLAAAKGLAETQRRSLGEVISALARSALRSAPTRRRTRNGVPLLPGRKRMIPVTSERVRQLCDQLP
jgi:hypothetical protein